jgi:hypothetical protein
MCSTIGYFPFIIGRGKLGFDSISNHMSVQLMHE